MVSLIQKSVGNLLAKDPFTTYQAIDIISMRQKNMAKRAQWTRKQSLLSKNECRRFWPSLHQGIGSTLMRRRCFLLQCLTVGWQLFTSAERKLTNSESPWPFSATLMDHKNSRSSLLGEQGTLWRSIDKIQTGKGSITVTTRRRG